MEPLTAFGLAASIVQFVNFATTLIKKGSEINDSVAGLSRDLEIDETYEDLNRFSSTLEEGCSIEINTADPEIRDSTSSLATLAKACKSDCSTLLEIIHSLKVQGGPKRRVKSLKAAFAAMRKEDVINQLKERLTRTETQITVHLCRISKHHLERHTRLLEHLAGRAYALEVDQRASFDTLAIKLNEIRAVITSRFKIMPDNSEVEAMRDQLTALGLAERDITREQAILSSLSFEHRLDRYEAISRAYNATLSSIFHPDGLPSQGERLLEWLRCGQGIFWVTAVKFLICIDGLDEYRGDHVEICTTLSEIGLASDDIKICVSSRPWNDFQKAFGSEGVFLWVFLVTKEVREGMSNHDSLSDLYRRVKGFPPDLDQFFKHILSSVDPFYGPKMSSALQTAVAVEEPLELSIYDFQEQEFDNPNYALDLAIKHSRKDFVEKRLNDIEKRLNGWCKGLLEVHYDDKVYFLHRTVRDFLKTRETGSFLECRLPKGFCVGVSIVKAHTAWIKSRTFLPKRRYGDDETPRWKMPLRKVRGLLKAASHLEGYSEATYEVEYAVSAHIDAFEEAIGQHETASASKFGLFRDSQQSVRLLRSRIFTSGLSYYLHKKLS
ncbi:hypothetical protein J7T55_015298 [Diaporthe amygdali]|uniref:uncharacterized protein n=1 Tax=Phomopsis amygdali TaxID=1214568 RepID=UPI0022FF3B2A|nr:uncharacterized protein J7T55_015298 [Diaporthe amygdali]KAJ0120569.1 hypothetical protein J7T55_015298 [Diaporthe amygdali]